MLYELDENPVRRRRVQERDEVTFCTLTGFTVHEAETRSFQSLEFGADVGDFERYVMEPRSSSGQEAPDGGVGGEWLEKFDLSHEGDLDPLGFERLRGGTVLPGEEFVESTALCDGVHGDAHVMKGSIRRRRIHHL